MGAKIKIRRCSAMALGEILIQFRFHKEASFPWSLDFYKRVESHIVMVALLRAAVSPLSKSLPHWLTLSLETRDEATCSLFMHEFSTIPMDPSLGTRR